MPKGSDAYMADVTIEESLSVPLSMLMPCSRAGTPESVELFRSCFMFSARSVFRSDSGLTRVEIFAGRYRACINIIAAELDLQETGDCANVAKTCQRGCP